MERSRPSSLVRLLEPGSGAIGPPVCACSPAAEVGPRSLDSQTAAGPLLGPQRPEFSPESPRWLSAPAAMLRWRSASASPAHRPLGSGWNLSCQRSSPLGGRGASPLLPSLGCPCLSEALMAAGAPQARRGAPRPLCICSPQLPRAGSGRTPTSYLTLYWGLFRTLPEIL